MKAVHVLSLLVLVLALVGCNPGAKERIAELEAENARLQDELVPARQEAVELAMAFNSVVDALDEVTQSELLILDLVMSPESESLEGADLQLALEDIDRIQSALQKARDREAELMEQLEDLRNAPPDPTLVSRIEELQLSAARLGEIITQKEALIAGLELELQRERTERTVLEGDLEQAEVREQELLDQFQELDEAVGKGYVLVGTRAELKLLRREQVLRKDGRVFRNWEAEHGEESPFNTVDIAEPTVFLGQGFKDAEIVSAHGKNPDLYRFNRNGDQWSLILSDPSRFWRESHYLIVRVKMDD